MSEYANTQPTPIETIKAPPDMQQEQPPKPSPLKPNKRAQIRAREAAFQTISSPNRSFWSLRWGLG
jgi:hypothetical protein